eukprot:1195678-Prorocentrum_minimum.AAC.1
MFKVCLPCRPTFKFSRGPPANRALVNEYFMRSKKVAWARAGRMKTTMPHGVVFVSILSLLLVVPTSAHGTPRTRYLIRAYSARTATRASFPA